MAVGRAQAGKCIGREIPAFGDQVQTLSTGPTLEFDSSQSEANSRLNSSTVVLWCTAQELYSSRGIHETTISVHLGDTPQ